MRDCHASRIASGFPGKCRADLIRARRVYGCVALFDMSDDAFLVDDEGCASGEAHLFAQYSVGFRYLTFEVAQQREGDADVFGESLVGGKAIDADSEYLSFRSFEFGDIRLIRLQLLRSASGEGQHIKCQHDIFLALEIRELHLRAILIDEREVRSRIAHLEMSLRRLLGRRSCDESNHSKHRRDGFESKATDARSRLENRFAVDHRFYLHFFIDRP